MRRQVLYWCSAYCLVLSATVVHAQVPPLIRYQGTLVDANNVPLEGTYNLTFRMYDASTGGSLLWTETQAATPVSRGVFNVLLGQTNPLTLAFDKDYWLTTQVGTDAEMAPRQRLTSVPYALRAQTAESLTGSGPDISVRANGWSNISIANATWTMIPFEDSRWDTDRMHDSIAYPERLTAKTAGKYLIHLQLRFTSNSTGYRRASINWFNQSGGGGSAIAMTTIPATTDDLDVVLMTHYSLAAGDYVVAYVCQTSGGALNVAAASATSPIFGMVKVE